MDALFRLTLSMAMQFQAKQNRWWLLGWSSWPQGLAGVEMWWSASTHSAEPTQDSLTQHATRSAAVCLVTKLIKGLALTFRGSISVNLIA